MLAISKYFNNEIARSTESTHFLQSIASIYMISWKKQFKDHPADAPTDYLSQLLLNSVEEDALVIRDTVLVLFFGGQDNLHNALSWCMLSLLRKPEWMDRMREEALRLNQFQKNGLAFAQLGVGTLRTIQNPFVIHARTGVSYPLGSLLRDYSSLAGDSQKPKTCHQRRHLTHHIRSGPVRSES
jgi:cytochrome P450